MVAVLAVILSYHVSLLREAIAHEPQDPDSGWQMLQQTQSRLP